MHICMEQNNNNLFWNKYYYILLFQFSSDTAYYDTSYKNHPNPSKRSDLHMLLLCRLRRLGQEKRQDQQSQQSSGESDSGHMFHRKHISPVERSLEVANMTW